MQSRRMPSGATQSLWSLPPYPQTTWLSIGTPWTIGSRREEEVFVHARDPYTRIDVLDSSRQVRILVDGAVVAETDRPRLLLETGLAGALLRPA